ncbi:hypothetical protein, partial [Streptococcus sp. DD13]
MSTRTHLQTLSEVALFSAIGLILDRFMLFQL